MSDRLTLAFHGAARTVTGSCMEFSNGDRRLLVDCGMFQGSRSLETLNRRRFAFDPRKIDGVVLTHAHIDHCGLLPRLVAEGYDGPIWCTAATADLLEFMLADAGRIQESEASRRNRRRDRADEAPIEPIYTEQDGLEAWRRARPVPLGEWFEPVEGFRARLWNAGHILGAASVEIEAADTRILCSGDIGPGNKAFEPPADGPAGVDHLICESTYGSRHRDRLTIEDRRSVLEREINQALARGGNLIVPVFALERTQELLLDIAVLIAAHRIRKVPVFIDSPLATQATRVFQNHAADLAEVGDRDVFADGAFHYVKDTAESIALNHVSGAIILAASGMCEAGRIRHHLRHNLARRESTVLFVGFQAKGTLGRVILEGAKRVRMWGEDIAVRAQIRHIDSYSAHADQDELLRWIAARQPVRGSLFLTHGEPTSSDTLRALIAAGDHRASILRPEIGEAYELTPGTAAKRIRTGDPALVAAVGLDWQNSYAGFATGLKQSLLQIADPAEREQVVHEMEAVLARHRGQTLPASVPDQLVDS